MCLCWKCPFKGRGRLSDNKTRSRFGRHCECLGELWPTAVAWKCFPFWVCLWLLRIWLDWGFFFFFCPHGKPLQYLNCFQFSHHLELNFLGSQKKTNKKKQPWKGQLRVFLPHSIWSSCPACRASRRPERCPAGKLQRQKQRLKHACHQSDIIWAFSPLLSSSSMIKCHWKNILSNETRSCAKNLFLFNNQKC